MSVTKKYLVIMLLCYAGWGVLYVLTQWIGAVRGPAFEAATPVDAMLPYLPFMHFPYLLCYVMPFGLFLISTDPEFLKPAYRTFIIANLAAFVFFAAFPVLGPERDSASADGSFVGMIIRVLRTVDTRYDALPSLHVTNPWLVALLSLYASRSRAKQATFIFIAILISISTMLIRQHYFLDVITGMALAFLSVRLVYIPKKNYELRITNYE